MSQSNIIKIGVTLIDQCRLLQTKDSTQTKYMLFSHKNKHNNNFYIGRLKKEFQNINKRSQ